MEPREEPLKPLTPRQRELMRLIQSLAPDARHTIKIVCRGSEPWEIQEIVEHRKIGDVKPDSAK
jgi:hypothetical protein